MANRAGIASRFRGDEVFNRTEEGDTFTALVNHIEEDVSAWQAAAETQCRLLGSVVIWMTGNDVYGGLVGGPYKSEDNLIEIGVAVKWVAALLQPLAESVVILGPLPRLSVDIVDTNWEATGAYHLERTLTKVKLGERVRFLTIGRTLTRKIGRMRHGMRGCEARFEEDGVNLTREGYDKLADATWFPVWLTM